MANRSYTTASLVREGERKNRSFSFIGDFSSLTPSYGGNALAYAVVERGLLGKEQSRVKLQTRKTGGRAGGGRLSVRRSFAKFTETAREVRRCRREPRDAAGRAGLSIKKEELRRGCRGVHFLCNARDPSQLCASPGNVAPAAVKWHELTQTNARFRRGSCRGLDEARRGMKRARAHSPFYC